MSQLQDLLNTVATCATHDRIVKPPHTSTLTKYERVLLLNKRQMKIQSHEQLPLIQIQGNTDIVNPTAIPEAELAQGLLQGTIHRRLDLRNEIIFSIHELTQPAWKRKVGAS